MIYLALLLLSIPAIWNLITPGFFEPHDLHHLADIFQMSRAIDLGQLPPRWAPDFTHGYGYPLFNYYYLTPFYIGSAFFKLLGSLTLALKLTFLSTFLISIVGMYKFLRLYFGKTASLLGTILFLYTPYRSVQIYVRGAVGEALSLALMPVVAYFFINLVRERSKKNFALASFFWGIFLLTHNYMWALFLPFLGLLLLIEVSNIKQRLLAIINLVLSGLLGFGVAAYWIVPALIEIKNVPRLTPFLLEDHFPFLKQLILPSWGYGSSVWGPYDEISFQIGLVNLFAVAAILFLIVFRKKIFKKDFKLVSWILFSFFITVAFMNIRTLPIWKIVPFYNFIQFPWRLLMFTTFFSSIALALFYDKVGKKIKLVLPILLFAIIGINFSYFRPSHKVYKSDQDYYQLFFHTPGYSEDYLLLSKWADEKPLEAPKEKFEIDNGEILKIIEISDIDWKVQFDAGESAKLTFNSYYFPGWLGRLDGKDVDLSPGKPYGQVELEVPQGKHEVEVYWAETDSRKLVDFISLASILITFYLLLPTRSNMLKSKDE